MKVKKYGMFINGRGPLKPLLSGNPWGMLQCQIAVWIVSLKESAFGLGVSKLVK